MKNLSWKVLLPVGVFAWLIGKTMDSFMDSFSGLGGAFALIGIIAFLMGVIDAVRTIVKSKTKLNKLNKFIFNNMETQQEETLTKPNAIKNFFKIVGKIALGIVILIIAVVAYFWYVDYLDQKQKDKVEMTVVYDTTKCTDKNYPLYITIANNAKKPVKHTSFDIAITRKGYSNDLADYSNYETDLIIKPSYVSSNCWSYKLKPENKSYDNPSNLEFKISYKYITFEE